MIILDPTQIRVLGALIEKEIVTPEVYPLSLNALLAACNQRSSRDPVIELTEEQVRQALHALEDLGLTAVVRDSRVAKYEHRARTVLNLRRDETAVLCLLLLRGPQTPGELRSRADRLYSFDGLEAVESTLARLATEPTALEEGTSSGSTEMRPLVAVLPRQPGSREARWMHLLGGPVQAAEAGSANSGRARSNSSGEPASDEAASMPARVGALEREMEELRETLARLEAKLEAGAPAKDD